MQSVSIGWVIMVQRKKQVSGKWHEAVVDLPRRLLWRRNRLSPLPAGQPDMVELTRRMRRFEVFAHLPAPILAKLATDARIQVFRAGEHLWHQGETNRRVLFIEQGLAKTARRGLGGANRTYGLYGPGDSMGIYAIWAGMKYPTDAVAMSDGMTAILLDPDVLAGCAQEHPILAAELMVEIGRFTESFIRKIEIVSAGSVPQRIAALMVMMVERYGTEDTAGGAHLPIYLTLVHIGEIVDARLETVARALGRWKRQGWLSVGDDGFHFASMDKLRELLQTASPATD